MPSTGSAPTSKAIWRSLPLAERARFLRHAATLWDVHRHRIPPQTATIIEEALSTGQMRLMRAAFLGAARDRNGQASVTVRRIGQRNHTRLDAAMVFDCRGIRRDPARHASPLIAGLLASGSARIDPLGIGLDVDGVLPTDRPIGKGVRSHLSPSGPVSRAAFWRSLPFRTSGTRHRSWRPPCSWTDVPKDRWTPCQRAIRSQTPKPPPSSGG